MMIKLHNFYRGKQEKLIHPCNVPPDIIFSRKSKHLKVIPGDDNERRELQKKNMSKLLGKKGNTTMKKNNRQYVPYQLYKHVVSQFFIVEPKRDITTVEVQYVDLNGEQKWTPKKHHFKAVVPIPTSYVDSGRSGGRKTEFLHMQGLQFPINCNNATTGHKLQGATVRQLFAYAWSGCRNWVYVVLSRVSQRDGLFLKTKMDKKN